jgi:hypothetical protein
MADDSDARPRLAVPSAASTPAPTVPAEHFAAREPARVLVVVTAAVNGRHAEDAARREAEYRRGVASIVRAVRAAPPWVSPRPRVMIVDNGGARRTYLEQLGADVLYTDGAAELAGRNKGVKELADVQAALRVMQARPHDFVVKATGRYVVAERSPFFDAVWAVAQSECCRVDAVLRYGSYAGPAVLRAHDCVTGLIGMRAYLVQRVAPPLAAGEPVEASWAAVTLPLPAHHVVAMPALGVAVTPAGVDLPPGVELAPFHV